MTNMSAIMTNTSATMKFTSAKMMAAQTSKKKHINNLYNLANFVGKSKKSGSKNENRGSIDNNELERIPHVGKLQDIDINETFAQVGKLIWDDDGAYVSLKHIGSNVAHVGYQTYADSVEHNQSYDFYVGNQTQVDSFKHTGIEVAHVGNQTFVDSSRGKSDAFLNPIQSTQNKPKKTKTLDEKGK